jgi:hypothetical protein
LPPGNPGCWLYNPHGTGIDDPWRPPHVWPQTKYPVVPAYSRPSFGYFETRWRILPVCGNPPVIRVPHIFLPQPAPADKAPASGAKKDVKSPSTSPDESTPAPANPPKATPPRQQGTDRRNGTADLREGPSAREPEETAKGPDRDASVETTGDASGKSAPESPPITTAAELSVRPF